MATEPTTLASTAKLTFANQFDVLSLQSMASNLNDRISYIKSGSLCFWGSWFGLPYDNVHRIVSCSAERNALSITFNEDETLTIWSPYELIADEATFRITQADRVRWEWFNYGDPKTQANLYYIDYVKKGDRITVQTNDPYPVPETDSESPAVEMW
jgi:hypothetical protein